MLKFKRYISLILLIVGAQQLSAQEVWDWDKCLQYAIDNNLQIQLDAVNISLAELQLQQDRLNLTPFVQTAAGYNYAVGRTVDMSTYQYVTKPVNTGNIQFSLNQPVFEGLKNLNSLKKSKIDLQAAKLDNETQKMNIQLQLLNAYLNILNAQEQLDQAKKQLSNSQEQYQNNRNLVEAGALAERMLVDNESQIASDEYNITQFQQQVQLAYLALKAVLQLDPQKDIIVPQPDLEGNWMNSEIASVENVYQKALTNRPDINSAKSKIESSQLGIKIAKSGYMPSLSFFSGVGTNLSDQFIESQINGTEEIPIGYLKSSGESVYTLYPVTTTNNMPFGKQFKNNMSYAVGVNLSIPIYNRRLGYLSTQRARLALEQSKYNESNIQYSLLNSIQEAHIKALSSQKNYEAAQKSWDAAQKSYEFAQERLASGAISQLELNLAQNSLFIAQSRWTQAKYDYIFNIKLLDYYSGNTIDFK